MIKNAGARMRSALQDFPKSGLSMAARAMSLFSTAVAALVALCVVWAITVGTMSYLMPGQLSFTIGNPPQNKPTSIVKKRLDNNCPEIKNSTRQDPSQCTWTPRTLTPDEVAAKRKANLTPYNLIKSAIRTLCWSIPPILLAIGLLEAAKCLNGLASGQYFQASTVGHLRNFAIFGLLYVLLHPFTNLLGYIILNAIYSFQMFTWKFWPPRIPWAIFYPGPYVLSADDRWMKFIFGLLIVHYAFTLTVIATVMAKASTIVEDHAEII